MSLTCPHVVGLSVRIASPGIRYLSLNPGKPVPRTPYWGNGGYQKGEFHWGSGEQSALPPLPRGYEPVPPDLPIGSFVRFIQWHPDRKAWSGFRSPPRPFWYHPSWCAVKIGSRVSPPPEPEIPGFPGYQRMRRLPTVCPAPFKSLLIGREPGVSSFSFGNYAGTMPTWEYAFPTHLKQHYHLPS